MIAGIDPAAIQARIATIKRLTMNAPRRGIRAIQRLGESSREPFHLTQGSATEKIRMGEPPVAQTLL
jgi:hypothetical protein